MISYQVTLNIGDSEEEARTAFGDYITQYYPELTQAMDLSNWGPVGTPEQITEWFRTFEAAGVDHFICRFGSLDQFGQVERFAREVLPAFAAERKEVSEMATVVESESLRKDAELIVDTCLSVEQGDVVTIICDDDHASPGQPSPRSSSSGRLAGHHEQRDAGAPWSRRHPLPDGPPANLHDAMLGSDEIIIMTNLEWANRFAHVSAVRESCANNVKIASVEEGMGTWDLTVEDILDATERAVAAIAAQGEDARARQDAARHRRHRLHRGRPALQVTPISKRGWMMGPLPLWAEVAFAAVEDHTHGTASPSTGSCSASAWTA